MLAHPSPRSTLRAAHHWFERSVEWDCSIASAAHRGGDNVYVYENARPPEVATGDADLIEAISAHIEKHIGEPDLVFHQLVSEYVHVDIHIVQPTEQRPWVTLVTSRDERAPDDDAAGHRPPVLAR